MKRNKLQRALAWAGSRKLLDFMPDKSYLQLMFWARMGQKLDLINPRSLNEKVQWLKLNDYKDNYPLIVDKYEARRYIKDVLGEEYLIPLVGGPWTSWEQIAFKELPNEFVLKTTHDSGGVVVCTDKQTLNMERAKAKIEKSLKNNYFWSGREYPYKYIKPQIVAEQYLTDESGIELKDYKILCMNGMPQNVMVCTGRLHGRVKYYFFDLDWEFLPLNHGDDNLPTNFTLPKPKHLDEMVQVAKILSKDFKLLRVDLYEANDRVYFGEMTLYPDSGFDTDILPSTDMTFGKRLIL